MSQLTPVIRLPSQGESGEDEVAGAVISGHVFVAGPLYVVVTVSQYSVVSH